MAAASSLRVINITTYLRELSIRDNCKFEYGIVMCGGGFNLIIRKEVMSSMSGKTIVNMEEKFRGPITLVDHSCDLYAIEFKKAGVCCMIEFFM